MKTKYDINQVPQEVLKKLGQSLLTTYETRGAYPYGDFDLHIDATALIQAATVKLRPKAEIDAEIVRVVRSYVEKYRIGNRPIRGMSFTALVPGADLTFPAKLEELLSEPTAEEAEAF